MHAGDALLVGFDLVKDVKRLEAAYNDSRGVTAAFNKNVLSVLNRALDADFDTDAFEHVAVFDRGAEWVEMRLRSACDQNVRVRTLDLDVPFARGEEMRTEISSKFRPERVQRELSEAGLQVWKWWTDHGDDFGLALVTTG